MQQGTALGWVFFRIMFFSLGFLDSEFHFFICKLHLFFNFLNVERTKFKCRTSYIRPKNRRQSNRHSCFRASSLSYLRCNCFPSPRLQVFPSVFNGGKVPTTFRALAIKPKITKTQKRKITKTQKKKGKGEKMNF